MRKRLRKKLRLREFMELGFEVSYRLARGVSAEEAESFLDLFLADAIEANNLSCGGGGQGERWSFCATAARRGSASPEQRAAVEKWLAAQPAVLSYELGSFRDMWHGDDESPTEQLAQDGHA